METLIIEEGKELQHKLDGRRIIVLSYVNNKKFLGVHINKVTGKIEREMINVNEVEDIENIENRKGEWKSDGAWLDKYQISDNVQVY